MTTLAVCQLYNPLLHGTDGSKTSSTDAQGHFLALHTYDNEFDESPIGFLNYWTPSHNTFDEKMGMNDTMKTYCDEASFRLMNTTNENYMDENNNISNLRELRNIPKVDIVETVDLNSGHMVAIKKTLWLSIFQRMLKKRYSNNKHTIATTHIPNSNKHKRVRYE